MKKVIVFGFILALAAPIFSQGLHYGIYGGVSMATIIERNDWAGDVSKSTKMGFQLGATVEYELLSFLSVGTDIGFLQKGDKIKDQFATSRASIGYLDIPLIIGYKIPLGNFKITAMVGPYTSIAVVGSKSFVLKPGVEPDFEWNFEETGHDAYIDNGSPFFGEELNSYKRFDTGISFGLKVQYTKYKLSASYSHGFVDIKPDETISARNSVFNITLAYLLK